MVQLSTVLQTSLRKAAAWKRHYLLGTIRVKHNMALSPSISCNELIRILPKQACNNNIRKPAGERSKMKTRGRNSGDPPSFPKRPNSYYDQLSNKNNVLPMIVKQLLIGARYRFGSGNVYVSYPIDTTIDARMHSSAPL